MNNNKFFPRPFPDPSAPAYGNIAAMLCDAFESGKINFTDDPDHFCEHIAYRDTIGSFTIYYSYLFAIIRSYSGYTQHSDDRIRKVLEDNDIIGDDFIAYGFEHFSEFDAVEDYEDEGIEDEDMDEADVDITGVFIGNAYNCAMRYYPEHVKYSLGELD